MNRLSISALAVAISLAAAPQLFAQSRAAVVVCRDGYVTSTRYGERACERHRGIDRAATARARREGVLGSNGVYAPNESRSVYDGGVYNGGVYNGGVYNGGVYNGGIYNGGVYGSGTNRGVYNGTVNGTGANRGVYGGTTTTGSNRSVYDNGVVANPGNNGRGHAYGRDKEHHGHDGDDR